MIFAATIAISLLHGALHLLGFVHAFEIKPIEAFPQPISKIFGLLWLVASLLFTLFVISAFLLPDLSPWIGLIAIICSQALIFSQWKEAKFGSIANLILLLLLFYPF